MTKPHSHRIAPETPDYVQAWAKDLVATIGKSESKKLLDDYRGIASNTRLPKADRQTAAKRRGTKLGSARKGHWVGREDRRLAGLAEARKSAVQSRRQAFQASYSDLLPSVRELHAKGESLQAIADELNRQGHTTRRGKPWNRMQVMRVLKSAVN